jgi:hypothetical protein
MSYNLEQTTGLTKTAQIGHYSASFSGNTSLGSLMTFTTLFSNISSSSVSGSSLTLPPGHYLLKASLGINNSNSIANYANYAWEIDGSTVGQEGSSTQDNKVGIDPCHALLTVKSGDTATVKIKITSKGGTTSINSDFSSIFVTKVDI